MGKMRTQDSSKTTFEVYDGIQRRVAMKRETQNLRNSRKYDRGLRPGNVVATGKCPAAIDTSLDGINSGTDGGKACWAATGPCHGEDFHRPRYMEPHDLYRIDLALRLARDF